MQQQQATFTPRVRRLAAGRYLIESATQPGLGHQCDVTRGQCGCKGFAYRGHCRHMDLALAADKSFTAWYAQATAAPRKEEEGACKAVPMTAGAPSGIVRPVRSDGEAYMASTGASGMAALTEIFG